MPRAFSLGVGTHISRPAYIDQLHPWLITASTITSRSGRTWRWSPTTRAWSITPASTRLGRVVLGKRVYVGVGAILLPGTTIGEDSVIGAGAVVHGQVPPASLAIGNPAKISPIKSVAAWQRASAARAPNWPDQGWTIWTGITEERKREQRDALANGVSGYVPATPAPGSPFRRSNPPGAR